MYLPVYKDSRGGHNRTSINQNFFKEWSSSMAYVLGFIFADGAIEDVQKSSRACYLALSSKDLSILGKIKEAMISEHQLYKRQSRLLTYSNGKQYVSSEQFILRIGNKTIYNDLLKLGVTPRKSLTILFPKIPLQYLPFFLRGYFDGDGCIYLIKNKYPRIVFTSGSNQFLQGVSEALSITLGIPLKHAYSQVQHSSNFCYQLHYNTKLSKQILEFMYKDLNKAPYLERKYLIYQKYLKLKQTAA